MAQKEIPANGHTEVIDKAVRATCTKTGLTEGSHCSVCGETIVEQEVIPAAHKFMNGSCVFCGLRVGTCGENLTWALTRDGTLTISGTGEMTDYSHFNSVPWYTNRSQISSVVMDEGVTSIGSYAFFGCRSLTTITIPEGVTYIGFRAFEGCTSLTSITIPGSVTSIGNTAFYECSGLTSVTISEAVSYTHLRAHET